MILPRIEPMFETSRNAKPSWLAGRAATVTAIALIGGAAGYAALSRSITTAPSETSVSVPAVTPANPPPPRSKPVPAAEPAPSAAAIIVPPSTPAAPPPHAAGVGSIDVAQLPDVPAENAPRPSRVPTTDHGPTKPAPESSDLRLEIIALDGVHHALDAARPHEALALLDQYAARFPAGKLREEATVLRIEALHANGDQAAADRLAERLFRDSPNTPYAARVRAALVKAPLE